jgi:hypothetical protein
MLINLLFLLLSLFLHAASNPITLPSHSPTPRDASSILITLLTNPSGTHTLAFSSNNAITGYLVETTPNSTYPYAFLALDASSSPIDPAALLSGAVSTVLQPEMELAGLIQQFGQGVWNFIACIGMEVYLQCLGFVGTCLKYPITLVNCAGLIACAVAVGGVNVEVCIAGAGGS